MLSKQWMNLYLSLPKLLRWTLYGDLIEIWIHFSIFIICQKYLNTLILRMLLIEISSIFASSFIEGSSLGSSPFYSSDIMKYMIFYTIDCVNILFLNMKFFGIVAFYHSLCSLIIIINYLRWRSKWSVLDFSRENIFSVTDLGVINNNHSVLC